MSAPLPTASPGRLPDDIAAAIDAALSAANDYGRTFTVQALHREEAVRAALEAAILKHIGNCAPSAPIKADNKTPYRPAGTNAQTVRVTKL